MPDEAAKRVSVALCTYNGERYVTSQLRSIANQSRPPGEVVIGDDGSTDGTVALVEKFIGQYQGGIQFRIAHRDRAGGVSANFERTVKACRGDLVALSDQDDVWHADRVEVALTEFESRPDLTLLHADARLVEADGEPLGMTLLASLYPSRAELEAIHRGDAFPVLTRRNLVTGATVMFRADLLKVALPFPPHWVHDEWLAALAAATGRVDVLERPVIDYRIHDSNQIGVVEPTLRRRLAQMVAPRGDRLERLAARSGELVERLDALGCDPKVLALARRKAQFEALRARYPRARWRRVGAVARLARGGEYAQLASQGRKDVLRDLLQPA